MGRKKGGRRPGELLGLLVGGVEPEQDLAPGDQEQEHEPVVGRAGAERLFDARAGLAGGGAGEALRLALRLALRADGDLDGLQAAPPTLIVSLMDPSGRACSTTPWPRLRASRRAFSTA